MQCLTQTRINDKTMPTKKNNLNMFNVSLVKFVNIVENSDKLSFSLIILVREIFSKFINDSINL